MGEVTRRNWNGIGTKPPKNCLRPGRATRPGINFGKIALDQRSYDKQKNAKGIKFQSAQIGFDELGQSSSIAPPERRRNLQHGLLISLMEYQ